MKKIERDTSNQLFDKVLELAKENGQLEKAMKIIDYTLGDSNTIELSNYEFDFIPEIKFGSSEGIYVDCFIKGSYTEYELQKYDANETTLKKEMSRCIGTIKTLKTDLEAMQTMGELCGTLAYYANKYINRNLEKYTPKKELEEMERYERSKKGYESER